MPKPTRAVERALDILFCFTREEPVLTLTQIAERVDLHTSTTHRLLATLESKRLVERLEENGAYRLGPELVVLGSLVRESMDLRQRVLPYLHRLATEHRETVDLAIMDDVNVVYLEVIESQQRVKIAATPGQRLPAFCTASGRAFLAFLPEPQAHSILKRSIRKYTEHTNVSVASLEKGLQEIREQGYATSEEEYEDGINAVAAPILDGHRHPLAVIAVVGPSFRIDREKLVALGQSVKATTDTIARDMGLVSQRLG